MTPYSYHRRRQSMARAQAAYDAQMPPDDDDTRECDECGEEYEPEYDRDGDRKHDVCEKCRSKNEG